MQVQLGELYMCAWQLHHAGRHGYAVGEAGMAPRALQLCFTQLLDSLTQLLY